jgi:hypothetical protein
METAMRSTPFRPVALILVMLATPLLTLTACASDAVEAERQQDEQAYAAARDRLYADKIAGNTGAIAADAHFYKLAVTKLREDRGICVGPNCHDHEAKQGHTKP